MAEQTIKSPDTERQERVPPGQRLVSRMPVLQFDGVPKTDLAKWSFRLFGLVAAERKLSWKELQALPRVKLLADIHCVTGWSMLDTNWEGVPASELQRLVKIKPEARFALVHSADGYTANLSLSELFAPDVIFAFNLEGRPLSPEYGYPLRLLVPRLYLWKSAKWATGVEFISENRRGYWEARGYHLHGDPWREERYSRDEKE
jgi:DMSO/TMAO reductase YedYZ molybdopterin-dependent catalytic subunit